MNHRLPVWAVLVLVAFGSPFLVRAESVQWSEAQPTLTFTAAQGKFRAWLENPMVTVSYGATIEEVDAQGRVIRPIQCGSSVPAGTRVRYAFAPHSYEDVSWYGSGKANDCPYGDWSTSEPPRAERCAPKNIYAPKVRARNLVDLYGTLAVAPPQKSIVVSGAACTQQGDARLCELGASGTVSAEFTFAPTSGQFWGGFWEYKYPSPSPLCYGSNGMRGAGDAAMTKSDHSAFVLQVPAQHISCSITVSGSTSSGTPPSAPTLAAASGASCVIGASHTITMQATDPDNDRIQYAIDWDNDGSIDQFAPATGYVSSGTAQTASRTFSTPGTKTVRVRALDERGSVSSWSTLAFNCAAPTADFCLAHPSDPSCSADEETTEGGDGGGDDGSITSADLTIRALPSLLHAGATTRVSWSAAHMTSCTVTGSNGDSWPDLLESPVGGVLSRPITVRTMYTLACIGTDGQPYQETATVNIVPSWVER